jgi:hypothetical protein
MQDRKEPKFHNLIRNYDTFHDFYTNLDSSYHQIIRRSHKDQHLVAVGIAHSYEEDAPAITIVRRELDAFIQQTQGRKRIILNEGGQRAPGKDEVTSIHENAESGLLAFRAKEAGIPIDSPEPPELSEAEELLQQKFTREQIFYYYFARQLPQWAKISRHTKISFGEYMNKVFNKLQTKLTALEAEREPDDQRPKWSEFEFSVDNFVTIHKDLFPDRAFNAKFLIEQTERLHLKDTSIQRLKRACSRIRDKYILDEVVKHWQNGESVFIVYGGEHIYALEPAFEMLGSADEK